MKFLDNLRVDKNKIFPHWQYISIANAIGDSIDNDRSEIGVVVDFVKDVAAKTTNTIVDAGTALYECGKYLWNKWFG